MAIDKAAYPRLGLGVRGLWTLGAGPGGKNPASAPRRRDDVARFALATTRARIQLAWAPWTELTVGLRGLGRGNR